MNASRASEPVFHGLRVPPRLDGARLSLEPLSERHVEALALAAHGGEVAYAAVPRPDRMREHVAEHLARAARGERLPFAQLENANGAAIGVTCFLNPRRVAPSEPPFTLEVGATWLAPAARGTGLNTEAKLLLLSLAFDTWGIVRVEFKTDARNDRSRAAIAGLGASLEGVHRRADPSRAPGEEGLLRDTAFYSILADDWPEVQRRLTARLGR